MKTRTRHTRRRARSRSRADAAPRLQQKEGHTPFFQAKPDKRVSASADPIIQRSVQHTGYKVAQDIDLLDPTTAPKGNTKAPGFTEALVNGKPVKELYDNNPTDLKNELFPLPTYEAGYTTCFNLGSSIQVDLSHKVRIIKPSPWNRKLSKGLLSEVLAGLIPAGAKCVNTAIPNQFNVVLKGNPDDVTFQSIVLTSEEEHVAIDQALLYRFVESYADDLQNLPNEFKTILPCGFHIGLKLKRNQYMNAFMAELYKYHELLDHEHGPHGYRFSVTSDSSCSTFTVKMRNPGIRPAFPSSKKWKP